MRYRSEITTLGNGEGTADDTSTSANKSSRMMRQDKRQQEGSLWRKQFK